MLHYINIYFNECNTQFGFRPNYSTTHAQYVLNEIIHDRKHKKKKTLICFLDFSKAFDKVNRVILMEKLLQILPPDLWYIIKQYYTNTSIIITNKNTYSDNIPTTLGVKQGGPMSPKLFSIYVNDMINEILNSNLTVKHYDLQLGIILYADDTTIICESEEKLQAALDIISLYCTRCEISINAKKTKIICTYPTKCNTQIIKINNEIIEYNTEFKFLGLWIMSNATSLKHTKFRCMKAMGAYYGLNNLGINNYTMPIKLKTFLIKTYCRSTLLYSMESIHLTETNIKDLQITEGKIVKASLNLSKYTNNNDLYGAISLDTIKTSILKRKLNFLLQLMENKLTLDVLQVSLDNIADSSDKSFLSQILRILNIQHLPPNLDIIKEFCLTKLRIFETEDNLINESEKSLAINYFLENRDNITNRETLMQILTWNDNIEKRIKRPRLY